MHATTERPIVPHERMANEIMDIVSYEEIPEFLSELHNEIKRRFEQMAGEAQETAELKGKLYVRIRDCFQQRPIQADKY